MLISSMIFSSKTFYRTRDRVSLYLLKLLEKDFIEVIAAKNVTFWLPENEVLVEEQDDEGRLGGQKVQL
jgi:hypothetical protein